MSAFNTKPATRQAPRNRVVAAHKFAVGASVMHGVGGRTEKSPFKITRQMPDGGDGFQYRIKSDRDGQERIVTEATLERI
jgi:hypothetical protein